MSNNSTIDLKELLTNLNDLNDVSHKVSKEIDKKNKILQGGIKDCKECKMYVNNTKYNK